MFPNDKLFWALVRRARSLASHKYHSGEQMISWPTIRYYLLGYQAGYLDAHSRRS